MSGPLVTVRVRACACPETPHPDGDEVYILPVLSLEGGSAAELDQVEVMGMEGDRMGNALLARWTATFVRYGAVGWNWMRMGENGRLEPEPFDVERLVSDYGLAKLVAGKANEIYQEALLRPLLEAAEAASKQASPPKKRSPRGRTAASISPLSTATPSQSESSSEPASDGPPLRIAR
jgi:hypothetical protein